MNKELNRELSVEQIQERNRRAFLLMTPSQARVCRAALKRNPDVRLTRRFNGNVVLFDNDNVFSIGVRGGTKRIK